MHAGVASAALACVCDYEAAFGLKSDLTQEVDEEAMHASLHHGAKVRRLLVGDRNIFAQVGLQRSCDCQ